MGILPICSLTLQAFKRLKQSMAKFGNTSGDRWGGEGIPVVNARPKAQTAGTGHSLHNAQSLQRGKKARIHRCIGQRLYYLDRRLMKLTSNGLLFSNDLPSDVQLLRNACAT
jgi:hypothetical protein